MLISEIEEKIRTMELQEVYEFLLSEEDAPLELLKKARFGFISPKIDIYDYFRNTLMLKSKTGMVIHRGHKFNIEDVYTDMEKRTKAIKKWLLKKYGAENSLTESR